MTFSKNPWKEPLVQAKKYLPVNIGSKLFGIRCDLIRAQAKTSELSMHRSLPCGVAGFITRCSRLIPVFDLGCTQKIETGPQVGTILVLHIRPANNPGLPVGLRIDGVADVAFLDGKELPPATGNGGEISLPCLLEIGEQMNQWCDFEAMVARTLFSARSVLVA